MAEFNFIILNGNERTGDAELFFPGEDVIEVPLLPRPMDMIDMLVACQVFASKSKARAEWPNLSKKLGLATTAIPDGWSDFESIGRLKTRITILNPILSVEDRVAAQRERDEFFLMLEQVGRMK